LPFLFLPFGKKFRENAKYISRLGKFSAGLTTLQTTPEMLVYTKFSFLHLVSLHVLADMKMKMVFYNLAPNTLHMRTGVSKVPHICTASVGGFKSVE
jgi:hypothetical protein